MKSLPIYKRFEATVHHYEMDLDKYSISDFTRKPSPEIWSSGQVYEHIISNTINFHVKQIEMCLSDNENFCKRKSTIGYIALFINRIPNVKISIPPEENKEPCQPTEKFSIKKRLVELCDIFYQLALKIDNSKTNGKRFHPGFGYLSAVEWYAFVEMHMRYHWKDKNAIDKYLYS